MAVLSNKQIVLSDPAMPIFGNVEIISVDNDTSATVPVPPGTLENDHLVLVLAKTAAVSFTGLSGWTQKLENSGVAGLAFYVYEKTAEAADAVGNPQPTYSVTWSGADDFLGYIVNINQARAIGIYDSSVLASGSTSTCPAVEVGGAGNLILRSFAATEDDITIDGGEPAGTTGVAVRSSPNNLLSLGLAYEIAASAGNVGSAAFSLTAPQPSIAATLAVRAGDEIAGHYISNSANNLNLSNWLQSNTDWNGTDPQSFTVVIPSGVLIGSTSTATPALTVGTFPAGSSLLLINRGRIQGRGGSGGNGVNTHGTIGSAGGAGGNALALTDMDVRVINADGEIWGGGGGGGGGGGANHPYRYESGCVTNGTLGHGGGGGGGAGSTLSGGGARANPSAGNGSSGGTETGGNGGHGSPTETQDGDSPPLTRASSTGGGGGKGGDPGEAGSSGASASGYHPASCNGNSFGGKGGGAAGLAIDQNGFTAFLLSGDASPNIKGAVS